VLGRGFSLRSWDDSSPLKAIHLKTQTDCKAPLSKRLILCELRLICGGYWAVVKAFFRPSPGMGFIYSRMIQWSPVFACDMFSSSNSRLNLGNSEANGKSGTYEALSGALSSLRSSQKHLMFLRLFPRNEEYRNGSDVPRGSGLAPPSIGTANGFETNRHAWH